MEFAKLMKLTITIIVALLVGTLAGWAGHGLWSSSMTGAELQKTFDGVSRVFPSSPAIRGEAFVPPHETELSPLLPGLAMDAAEAAASPATNAAAGAMVQ